MTSPTKQAQRDQLTAQMGEPNFWDNPEKAQQIIAQLKPLNGLLKPYEELAAAAGDLAGPGRAGRGGRQPRSRAGSRAGRLREAARRVRAAGRCSSGPQDASNAYLQHPGRHRRHRGVRLGADAPAHVRALGRAARLPGRDRRRAAQRGGRHPQRHAARHRRLRLRQPAERGRRASAGAHQPVRLQRPPADVVRGGGRDAGDRGHDRDRDPLRRPAARHVPQRRPRRPAPEQDRERRALHAPADRHRRREPQRAQPAQERRQWP